MYGISTDELTPKTQALSVWSGDFYGNLDAEATARHGAKSIALHMFVGGKCKVQLPEGITFPRTELNYKAIDNAISEAIAKWYSDNGYKTIQEMK